MRIVIQRVSECLVTTQEGTTGEIGRGMLILLGIEESDGVEDIEWLAQKIVQMRIFADEEGKMNLDLREIAGDILVVSQFTLHALTKKGNRPSFIRAARPEKAIPLYNQFIEHLEKLLGKAVFTGTFGAMMQVSLINDGPVTIIVDSKNRE
jgi:D-aminoacyl-tRNA deacylase